MSDLGYFSIYEFEYLTQDNVRMLHVLIYCKYILYTQFFNVLIFSFFLFFVYRTTCSQLCPKFLKISVSVYCCAFNWS